MPTKKRAKVKPKRSKGKGLKTRRRTVPAEAVDTVLLQHKAHCSVCNHPQVIEIETDYVNGIGAYELAEDYRLNPRSLSQHFRFFGLDKQRDDATIKAVDMILDRSKIGKFVITPDNPDSVIKLMTLRAKLRGEIVDKQEGSLSPQTGQQVQDKIEAAAKKIEDNLLRRLKGQSISAPIVETDADRHQANEDEDD